MLYPWLLKNFESMIVNFFLSTFARDHGKSANTNIIYELRQEMMQGAATKKDRIVFQIRI